MKHEHGKTSLRGVRSSLALLSVALFMGCGAEASTSGSASSDDPNLAYEALSAKVQACQDENDACTTAAAGDATKTAACDTAQMACVDKTKTEQKQARDSLARAAGGCFRAGDEDDAGPEGPCGRRHHSCLMQHGPNDSQCLEALFSCLEKKAGAGPMQDAGLTACVDAAHSCVMSNMMQRGARGPAAGGGKPGAGGPIGPRAGSGAGPGKPGVGAGFVPGAGPGAPGGLAGAPAHAGGAAGGPPHFGGAAGGGFNAGPGSHAGGAPAHAAGGAGGGRH